MKNLENFGVQELKAKEMKEVNGGIFSLLVFAAIIIAAGIFANDNNDTTRTYVDGKRVGR